MLKVYGRSSRGNSEVPIMRLHSRMERTHVDQFVQVTVIVVTRPLEPFENALYALLEIQSTEIYAMNATRCQFPDHVGRELDPIIFHELVVMLHKNEVIAA